MRKTYILLIFITSFCYSCTHSNNKEEDTNDSSTIASESYVNNNVYQSHTHSDTELCVSQNRKHRTIFCPKTDYEEKTLLCVYDSLTKRTDSIQISTHGDRIRELFKGRNDNEVYALFLGGSGYCGTIVRVYIDRTKKDVVIYDEMPGTMNIQRTEVGFYITRYIKGSYCEDGTDKEWELEIDFDGNLIRTTSLEYQKTYDSNFGG